ncbi:AMP-binding protein [Streptomyces ehimensis]|uniref:AMP-binding protein n=1 Tax=Streptomyces ehimensis TaxID=68195 RepID=A0ABV9BTC1_9ACTN
MSEAVRQGTLVHSLLDEAVAEVPDKPAVRDAKGRWSYREVDEYSRAFEVWLEGQGFAPGDVLVVQLPASRELAAIFYGASRRGVIFAPLSTAMKAFQLRSVLSRATPRLVMGPAPTLAGLRDVTSVPVHDLESVWCQVERLRTLGGRAEPARVRPEDVAALIHTSGSTSAPTGVVVPHAQMTFASAAINAVLGYRRDDVVFSRFPMAWDVGLYKLALACLGRSELVLADGESDLVLLRRMREVGATVVPIVPSLATLMISLAGREQGAMPPVRMFTNTGAVLQQGTTAKLRELFPAATVVRQFGQTECKRVSIMPLDEQHERPGSVGRPLPGTRVLILDPQSVELPAGEPGEIVVAGPHVMPGYWQAPELTARRFRADAHTGEIRLHTGDLGWLDDDGYLYFAGRRDDMFKRKDIRMSTLEIEAAAMDIPGVRAAGVLPPTADRDLALCVEADLPAQTVLRELAQRLELAKVPAHCHVVSSFPLTANGKHDIREAARLMEGLRP